MSAHVSFSSLDSFETCPKRFQAERLTKEPFIPSDPLMAGRHIHAIIEIMVRACEEQGLETLSAETVASIVQGYFTSTKETGTALFNECMVVAKVFAKRYTHVAGQIIELEQWIECSLGEEGIPPLVMRLDDVRRLEDAKGPFIGNTDYKTGWAQDQDDSKTFQLHLQGYGLHSAYPGERLKVRNGWVRTGTFSDWYELQAYDLDNARRRAIASYHRQNEAKKKSRYPAQPGKQCTYCPIALQCVEAMGLRDAGHLALTVDDAKAQILDVQILEAALKTRKDSLKKWCDTNGPTRVENEKGEEIEAGYKAPAPKLTIDNLVEAHYALGDEFFGLINSLSASKLKKMEDDPRLHGNWTTTQGKPRFSVGKAKDDDGED